jgi:hypothetical protein
LTEPFELGQNVAVFEVIEAKKPFTAKELIAAAKKAYELELSERAFEEWLVELRRKAKIKFNPDLLPGSRDLAKDPEETPRA